MKIRNAGDVLHVLRATGALDPGSKRLTPNQRLVVLTYAASEQNADGSVVIRATELADTLGMPASVLSRTRKELVELGWLEESGTVGRVKLYRLTPLLDQDAPSGTSGRTVGHLRVVGS